MPELDATDELPPAGLLSRLGAIVSDSLVVFGLLALSTLFLFVPLLSVLGKKAMTPSEVGWTWSIVYFVVMLSVWFAFYGYFWTRSGQTIGMRAWRIRVEAEHAKLVTWRQALTRWIAADIPWLPCLLMLVTAEHYGSIDLKHVGQGLSLLGIAAWLVMYLNPRRLTWHDRFSRTHVVRLPKL